MPVDISSEALHQLKSRFDKTVPSLNFEGIEGEYFEALAKLKNRTGKQKAESK